jgi:zinc protease
MNRSIHSLWQGARMGFGLACCLLLPSLMIAQLDRSRPPAPAPPPIVHLGEHASFTLGNGMRVIVVENRKLPLVSVQVRFDVPPVVQGDKAGYIDMFGELLATGTSTRTKEQIDEAVDQLGAQLFTTSDGVYASGLKRNLPALLAIVEDVTTNASFSAREMERVRKRALSSVKQRKDDPDAIAEVVGRSVTFGRTHPYGEVASEKSIGNVKQEHLVAYYKRFFRPGAGYLVFVGDITLKEAKALSKKHFSKWKVPMNARLNDDGVEVVEGLGEVRRLERPSVPSGQRRVVMVDRPGAAQSVIRVTFPLNLHPKDIRTMSAQVMNTILGGGVFNARLMQNLRENKAFTYGAYSNLEVDRFNGSFSASVSVRTEVTDSAITEILRELERIRMQPVTAEELELTRNYMAGSFARNLEDPRTVARFALNTYLNELPKDHYATYLKRLETVTAEDVTAAAQEFLHPDQAILFVVGDREKIQHKLPALAADPNMPILFLDENGEIFREVLKPAPGKTAEAVVEDHLNAIGGRSAIAAIKDMHLRIGTHIGKLGVVIHQYHGPNGTFRSESSADDMGMLQEIVFDGSRAVSRTPQGQEELTDIDLQEVMYSAAPVPEMDLSQIAERLTLAGITTVEGEEAYKVVMMTTAGTTISDFYSVTTGLKLRRIEQKFIQGRSMNVTTDYRNYQQEKGVLFPRIIQQGGGPMGEVVLTVEHIDINTGYPFSFFATGLPPLSED